MDLGLRDRISIVALFATRRVRARGRPAETIRRTRWMSWPPGATRCCALCWTCAPGMRYPARGARRPVSPRKATSAVSASARKGVTVAQPPEILFVLEVSDACRLFSVDPRRLQRDGHRQRMRVARWCRGRRRGRASLLNEYGPSVGQRRLDRARGPRWKQSIDKSAYPCCSGATEGVNRSWSGCVIWYMGTSRNPLPLMQPGACPGLRRTPGLRSRKVRTPMTWPISHLDDEYLRDLVDQ